MDNENNNVHSGEHSETFSSNDPSQWPNVDVEQKHEALEQTQTQTEQTGDNTSAPRQQNEVPISEVRQDIFQEMETQPISSQNTEVSSGVHTEEQTTVQNPQPDQTVEANQNIGQQPIVGEHLVQDVIHTSSIDSIVEVAPQNIQPEVAVTQTQEQTVSQDANPVQPITEVPIYTQENVVQDNVVSMPQPEVKQVEQSTQAVSQAQTIGIFNVRNIAVVLGILVVLGGVTYYWIVLNQNKKQQEEVMAVATTTKDAIIIGTNINDNASSSENVSTTTVPVVEEIYDTINNIKVPVLATSTETLKADTNNNGVHDDVERIIASKSSNQDSFNKAIAIAKVIQEALDKKTFTKTEALKFISDTTCLDGIRTDNEKKELNYNYLTKISADSSTLQDIILGIFTTVGKYQASDLLACTPAE